MRRKRGSAGTQTLSLTTRIKKISNIGISKKEEQWTLAGSRIGKYCQPSPFEKNKSPLCTDETRTSDSTRKFNNTLGGFMENYKERE
jgi:hypothetical protein